MLRHINHQAEYQSRVSPTTPTLGETEISVPRVSQGLRDPN
jgi:hypothetical protein